MQDSNPQEQPVSSDAPQGRQRITRRRLIQTAAMGSAAAVLVSACSPAAKQAATVTPTVKPTPGPTITPLPTITPAPRPGAVAGASKIDHIVVFMKENHTFDNLFAAFPGANGKVTGMHAADQLATDLSHSHTSALAGPTKLGYAQYTKDDAPNYWTYARNYAICDNFFSEVMGPSPANHLMFLAGQSPFIDYPVGFTSEAGWTCPGSCWEFPTIMDRLTDAGLTWRNYWAPPWSDTFMVSHLLHSPYNVDYTQFITDASAGKLPHLSFVKTSTTTSDHPPNSLTVGENYQVREINAIIQGGLWDSTAIFVTWDDWGGFYDHVTPAVVERWLDGTPFRYGPRVPLLVLGGYARQGYISHSLGSFVSLTRMVERIFGLQPLTQRDASASDMLDCFDFTSAPTQPIILQERPAHPHPLPPNPYVP